MKKGIKIEGYIFANTGNISNRDFINEFIEFVEKRNWYFGGLTKEVSEDELE